MLEPRLGLWETETGVEAAFQSPKLSGILTSTKTRLKSAGKERRSLLLHRQFWRIMVLSG